MDLNVIFQFVQSIGFPAVFCFIVLKMLEDERRSHKEETKSMTEALNNNTQVLTAIKQKLEDMDNHEY